MQAVATTPTMFIRIEMHLKIDLGAKVDFGWKKGMPPHSFWEPFCSKIHTNPEKTPSKKHLKIDTEKVEKMRGKCSQNGAKKGAEIEEKSEKLFCADVYGA